MCPHRHTQYLPAGRCVSRHQRIASLSRPCSSNHPIILLHIHWPHHVYSYLGPSPSGVRQTSITWALGVPFGPGMLDSPDTGDKLDTPDIPDTAGILATGTSAPAALVGIASNTCICGNHMFPVPFSIVPLLDVRVSVPTCASPLVRRRRRGGR